MKTPERAEMEDLHTLAPVGACPDTTSMRSTAGKGAADPGPTTYSGRAGARHCECVTPSPQLYRRTIMREVIIGGHCHAPGDVVLVTQKTLRQLVDEFAVDPRERG